MTPPAIPVTSAGPPAGPRPHGPTKDHEDVARAFHEAYEDLAPQFGWNTQPVSRVAWEDLPQNQRDLMVAVVDRLVGTDVMQLGPLTPAQLPLPAGPKEAHRGT